jgi:hypothetical protein
LSVKRTRPRGSAASCCVASFFYLLFLFHVHTLESLLLYVFNVLSVWIIQLFGCIILNFTDILRGGFLWPSRMLHGQEFSSVQQPVPPRVHPCPGSRAPLVSHLTLTLAATLFASSSSSTCEVSSCCASYFNMICKVCFLSFSRPTTC